MPSTEPESGESAESRLQPKDSTRFPVLRSTRSQDGWSFEIAVPAESPYFEGHFEGSPILPGVAQLALLLQLYRLATGTLAELREVSVLRFRHKVLPGHILQASISRPDSEGRSSFALSRQGAIVSRGTVRWSEENR